MSIRNYKSGSLKKFFSRGIPFHAVNFSCNPFDVCGIATEFRETRNRQNVIQRVVQAQYDQLVRIGAAIVLSLQFLANKYRVLRGSQTVGGGFLEVAGLAKGIPSAFHRWKTWRFSTTIAEPGINHFLLPLGRQSFDVISAILAVRAAVRRVLTTTSAQSGLFKSIIAPARMTRLSSPENGIVLIFFAELFECLSISYADFFRSLELLYNRLIHRTHDLRSWVKLVWPTRELILLGWASHILTQNPCKYRWNGGLS